MKNSTIVRTSMAVSSIAAVAQAKLIHDSNWAAGINVVTGVVEQFTTPVQYFDQEDVTLKDTLIYCTSNAVGKALFTGVWGAISNINSTEEETNEEETIKEMMMNTLVY